MKTLKIKTKIVSFDSDVKWPDLKRWCPKCDWYTRLVVTACCYFNTGIKRKDIYVDRIRILNIDLEEEAHTLREHCVNPECDWSESVYIERKKL